MSPFLCQGDWVGVQWTEATSVPGMPGDLVLTRDSSGEFIVHRVVTSALTKGDHSIVTENFSEKQIWGRIRFLKKGGSSREILFHPVAMDRLIANLSFMTSKTSWPLRALPLRLTLALGFVRRSFL